MLPIDFNQRFDAALALLYRDSQSPLHEAILYSLLGPGKRLRPKLVYLSALAASGAEESALWEKALPAMLAVEMVHCYSLVHDDLPAMDNDDYRRGRLSCHKKFGEATGILVGDALIADAFEVLSTSSAGALLQMRELAKAIGSRGMVLGQQADLLAEPDLTSWEEWREIHALKTGRLFESACVMGALSVGASEDVIQRLRDYARAFGIAFQLKDDLNDDADTVTLLGRDEVVKLLNQNVEAALGVSFALNTDGLAWAARSLVNDAH